MNRGEREMWGGKERGMVCFKRYGEGDDVMGRLCRGCTERAPGIARHVDEKVLFFFLVGTTEAEGIK